MSDIADGIVRPVLEKMDRDGWPQDFRAIVLGFIAQRFQEEADKASARANVPALLPDKLTDRMSGAAQHTPTRSWTIRG